MTPGMMDAALDAAFRAVMPRFDAKAPLSPDDLDRVADLIRHGYGVDDIALSMRRPPAAIRAVVRQFRRNGDLGRWFG